MKQPEAYIEFEVYEDKVNFGGIAKATLPDIAYLTQSITGAGIMGNIEAVIVGFVDAMTLTLDFRSPTDSATSLAAPAKHNLELRVAEQYWDTVDVTKKISADKYVITAFPKKFGVGSVAPASPADANGEYAVYYYAGYKDGVKLWEIDPWNYICNINGHDYGAEIKNALGK